MWQRDPFLCIQFNVLHSYSSVDTFAMVERRLSWMRYECCNMHGIPTQTQWQIHLIFCFVFPFVRMFLASCAQSFIIKIQNGIEHHSYRWLAWMVSSLRNYNKNRSWLQRTRPTYVCKHVENTFHFDFWVLCNFCIYPSPPLSPFFSRPFSVFTLLHWLHEKTPNPFKEL